jgi:hypothetical protein
MKWFTILARERFTADGMAVNIKDFTLRDDGEDDPKLLLSRPDLSHYCLNLERREAVFVSVPPGVELQQAPFYYQAQFEHADKVFTVSFDTFLDLSARIPPPKTLVLIHNIGRCGSTLLSKLFSQLESCLSYSEPDCFTQIGFWRVPNDPRDELWRSLLPACMKFTFKNAGSERPATAIVKFRSGCLNLLDLFLECFPNAKHLFLYRDCESWVASLISLTGRHRALPDLPREKALANCRYHNGRALDQSSFPFGQLRNGLSPIERLTVSWLAYIELVANVYRSRPASFMPVTYGELITNGEACLRRIFDHCGLPQDKLSSSVSAFVHDSQAGTSYARVDSDSGNKRQLTGPDCAQMQSILAMHPFIQDSEYHIGQ